jgi:hypothetical protein
MQNFISLDIENILPATRYFWKVRVWDKDGNISEWSKTSVLKPVFLRILTGMVLNG